MGARGPGPLAGHYRTGRATFTSAADAWAWCARIADGQAGDSDALTLGDVLTEWQRVQGANWAPATAERTARVLALLPGTLVALPLDRVTPVALAGATPVLDHLWLPKQTAPDLPTRHRESASEGRHRPSTGSRTWPGVARRGPRRRCGRRCRLADVEGDAAYAAPHGRLGGDSTRRYLAETAYLLRHSSLEMVTRRYAHTVGPTDERLRAALTPMAPPEEVEVAGAQVIPFPRRVG